MIRENGIFIFVNRDPLFFRFVNRAGDPPVRPSFMTLKVNLNPQLKNAKEGASALFIDFEKSVFPFARRA